VQPISRRISSGPGLRKLSPPNTRAEEANTRPDEVTLSGAQSGTPKKSLAKKLGLVALGVIGLAGTVAGINSAIQGVSGTVASAVCHGMVSQSMGGVVEDAGLQKKADWAVDQVAGSFADLQLDAKVLGSPDSNATVCSNGESKGTLYFTRGTLENLNDDELTFIAGHEAGHLKLHNHDSERDLHQSEMEADIEGLRVLKKKGLPTSVAVDALTKSIGSEVGESSTHPTLSVRLEALRK
jgi:Zn-dependent protease with chaperone function